MRHDRFSRLLAVLLVVTCCATVAILPLAGCRPEDKAASQEVEAKSDLPEVFYPVAAIPLPPLEYMKGGVFTVVTGTPKQVHDYCTRGSIIAPGSVVFGCTLMESDVITAPNPCFYAWEVYASLMCHEQGHVNGWPADHPA